MSERKIIEGNELIAKFMGYQILHRKYQYSDYNSSNEYYFREDEGDIVCDKNGHEVNLYPDGDPLFELSELPFDSSWEWLMPVVEKIEDFHNGIEYQVVIYEDEINIIQKSEPKWKNIVNISADGNGKRHNTWLAVVEFIKWYNKWKEK